MSILVILFVALLPVAALLWYIYKTDPVSEPIQQLSRAFLYGCLIVIPVGAVEELLSLVLAPFLKIPLFGQKKKNYREERNLKLIGLLD